MFPAYGRLGSVFANTGIEQRYSCVPLDWFSEPHNWVDRSSIYESAALDLIEKVARSALSKAGLGLDDLDGIITHPGGRKVLEAISLSLNIEKEALVHGWEVLRDYGNMSSPTVMFVLERTLASPASGRHLMIAFGPGFTVSFALVDI